MSRRRYIVSYDIRDPDRLQQVGKAIKRFGDRFQYSVYLCDLDEQEKISLRETIGALIDHRVDTVAVIDLGALSSQPEKRFEWIGAPTDLPSTGWVIW